MQSLSNHGFVIDVAYIQTNNPIDSILDETLSKCCHKQFKLIEASAIQSSPSANKKPSNQPSLKERMKLIALKIYSKLFVYDVFQTRFKNINKKALASIENDYDYVLSSSEPRSSHKLAKTILKKRRLKSKWIQYWGDPMSNDVASSKLFPFLEKREEKKMLELSSYAIYTNPGCARYMQKKYPFASKRISWIPTTDIAMDQTPVEKKGDDISYVGDYLKKYRDIGPFYEACKALSVKLTIAGSGDAELDSTDRIQILGRVSRSDAIRIEAKSKVLVVIDNEPKCDECIQVPGKLYHFALTNKYVLVISNSKNIVDDYKTYNRFVFCKNDLQSIVGAISDIMSGKYCGSFCSPLKDFSQDTVANVFIRILEDGYER